MFNIALAVGVALYVAVSTFLIVRTMDGEAHYNEVSVSGLLSYEAIER